MHYWFVHAYFTFVVFFSLKFSICQLLLLKQLIFTKIGSIPINHKDCLKYMVRMLQYVLLYMYRITGGNFEGGGGVHINGFLSIKCVLTFILVDFIFASFNWEGVSKIWYTSSRIVYFFLALLIDITKLSKTIIQLRNPVIQHISPWFCQCYYIEYQPRSYRHSWRPSVRHI